MINQIMVIFTNYIGVFLMILGFICMILSTEVKGLLLGAVFFVLGFIIVGVSYHHAPTLFVLSRSA